jgi:hypothetical protein
MAWRFNATREREFSTGVGSGPGRRFVRAMIECIEGWINPNSRRSLPRYLSAVAYVSRFMTRNIETIFVANCPQNRIKSTRSIVTDAWQFAEAATRWREVRYIVVPPCRKKSPVEEGRIPFSIRHADTKHPPDRRHHSRCLALTSQNVRAVTLCCCNKRRLRREMPVLLSPQAAARQAGRRADTITIHQVDRQMKGSDTVGRGIPRRRSCGRGQESMPS